MPKFLSLGLMAHVDAGKTTLSEAILCRAGVIKKAGRVDHGDTFLDTDSMEKSRGITIYSKSAYFETADIGVTILDTPGHVDFSSEMERVLSVLDAAVLIISAGAGVQSHTLTLWRLLEKYNLPVFIFVNKMDMTERSREDIIAELKRDLDTRAAIYDLAEQAEEMAGVDETLIEEYLKTFSLSSESVHDAIKERRVFPVWFGSALKNEGVDELFGDLLDCCPNFCTQYPDDDFRAVSFKVTHDPKGEREVWIKVLNGTIRPKDVLIDEKINGIRRYCGDAYENLREATPGEVVVLTGIKNIYAGMTITKDEARSTFDATLSPVLSYRLNLPKDMDAAVALPKLRAYAQEDPSLSLDFDDEKKEISIKLMGQVQTEIVADRIKELLGDEISFSESRIVYKETISNTVEGVGHFEPLRHYAEVHLLMEPLPKGSGLVFELNCSEDILDKNWQRLILTHLKERTHRGVLTGSPITDMKISVVSGRAHNKHTEGGDFRQATYRAVRQGLMEASNVLLEPYYYFSLTVPTDKVGRAMTDLERMYAKDFSPMTVGDGSFTRLTGTAPVSTIGSYGPDVTAYTGGLGSLELSLSDYEVCHNAEDVVLSRGYDPLADLRNTPDSVFCSHGAGVVVPWDQVKGAMHMPSVLHPTKALSDEQIRNRAKLSAPDLSADKDFISIEEIDEIMAKHGGLNKDKAFAPHKGIKRANGVARHLPSRAEVDSEKSAAAIRERGVNLGKPRYLLVDGYNIIHAWPELKALCDENIDSARGALLDKLSNHQAIVGCEIIAVFDAYKLHSHPEEHLDYNNIHVVFTKTAETADRYIEKFGLKHGKEYEITVATSDFAEQVIVRGDGCHLFSANDLLNEMEHARRNFNAMHGVADSDID